VVHLALDELSRRVDLPTTIEPDDSRRWRWALAGTGLWGSALDDAQAAVERSLYSTLAADGPGRWVLSQRHLQPRSEWALSWLNPDTGRSEDLVIDRTFIDPEDGVRWLIDYKNSEPEAEEALEDFLQRQELDYRQQLLRYRSALRALSDEPICCALFFTALGRLHHVKSLDLPAEVTA
jgi:ATP-dependent helicase/nuclease subunit A